MVKALRPGGMLFVEAPSTLQARGLSGVSMLWLSEEIRDILDDAGADVVSVVERPGRGYRFLRYAGRRRAVTD
jgi:hypothetical protein